MDTYLFNHYDKVVDYALDNNITLYEACEHIVGECRNTINDLCVYATENLQQSIDDGIYQDDTQLEEKLSNILNLPSYVDDMRTHKLL